jgi:hypothetical protein
MCGPEAFIRRIVRQIGHVEREMDDTALFTFALGIAAGFWLRTLAATQIMAV